jgi:hypothetical protein
MKTGNPM